MTNFVKIGDLELIITNKICRTIRIKEEWDTDVKYPEVLIRELKTKQVPADLFSFVQRLPFSKPIFDYKMELDNVAAIPVSTFDRWWTEQITQEVRNKVRKSTRCGVIVRTVEFSDDLVRQIKEIYDEIPLRRGVPFIDYAKSFDEVKGGNATFLDRADFLGAYLGDELIGFIKLVYTENFARTMGILAKVSRRDCAPMNALVAKAVDLCANKHVPYFAYGKFVYGSKGIDSLTRFKKDVGFQQFDIPRYYVPLTSRGKIMLSLNLHKRSNEILPKWMVILGLQMRGKLNKLRFKLKRETK